MRLLPLEDRVLVLQDAAAEMINDIIVPEMAQQKPATGKIIEIGPGKPRGQEIPIGYHLNDQFVQTLAGIDVTKEHRVVAVYANPLKPGDGVMFARYAGVPIEVNGKEHLIMRFSDIIAVTQLQ